MSAQVSFTLRGRNPDVLTYIANLSNDERFTPPEFANGMLDTLADAWSADVYAAAVIPDRTLNRAKGDLQAESHREYDRKTTRGEWWWYDPGAAWPKDAPFQRPVPELPDFPPLPRW